MSEKPEKSATIAITVPAMGESVTEAIVSAWHFAVGDRVTKGSTIAELETDKVSFEITAPESGILISREKEVGATISIGSQIAVIQVSGEAAATTPTSAQAASTQELASAAAPSPDAATTTTVPSPLPAAARLLQAQGLQSESIGTGSGKAGRITKGDVLASASSESATSAHPAPVSYPAPASHCVPGISQPQPRERAVKLTKIRQTIAKRLKESQNTAAILSTFNEVDVSQIMAIRQQYQDEFSKKHGIKLGFMAFFVKAVVAALKAFPIINATMTTDEVIYKNYYDIGVAIGTENGLVVPVLRNADLMSLAQIEQEIAALAVKARSGKLTIAELTGGTFSITNGGIYGSMLSTPIINPPQSAILGMHNIVKRAVVTSKDEIVVRPMMYLALSYDHRLIDGRDGVQFLVHIKNTIENPIRSLMDI